MMNWLRKNSWSYKKRGFIAGLILGIVWILISTLGVLICHWNPVDINAVPEGFCRNPILPSIFYLPTMIVVFPTLILMGLLTDQFGFPADMVSVVLLVLSVLVFVTISSLAGWLIGWWIEKKIF